MHNLKHKVFQKIIDQLMKVHPGGGDEHSEMGESHSPKAMKVEISEVGGHVDPEMDSDFGESMDDDETKSPLERMAEEKKNKKLHAMMGK